VSNARFGHPQGGGGGVMPHADKGGQGGKKMGIFVDILYGRSLTRLSYDSQML